MNSESKNPDSMNYGMLQNQIPSNSQKLDKYLGEVTWQYLEPHFRNGSLIYIDKSLCIKDVANAFAQDDKKKVAEWLKAGDALKPGQAHAKYWEKSNSTFTALVVSPFVIIQEQENKLN
ncbi:MAG TPA: DUF2288 family protein [Verrucomicrobia bacterium]|nr:DUF2288 family protein [Verrucomicrobiales bacterium]HIL55453.1 DUF2288 family protein [Verrucomicrobiota bacterium]